MMDPAYQSIFETLFICPLEWLFKNPSLSGLTNLKTTPMSTPIPVHPPVHPIPHVLPAQRPATSPWLLSCSSRGWADFTAQGRGAQGGVTCGGVPLGRTLPNTWPCCIIASPCMEATWNWNRRYYERFGKAWENQRLKGLKFHSLISLLLFPKGNQSPRVFSRPTPDCKNYRGFVFTPVGEWKPDYEPMINHNKPAAHG